jgi:limonene-1,2-epoxide hydrolase
MMTSIWRFGVRPLVIIYLVAGLTGCATSKGPDAVNSYQAVLQQTDPARAGTVTRGSPAEKAAIERFQNYLSEMAVDKIHTLTKDVYASDAYLNDTLKSLHGAQEIEHYFLATMENAESVTVKFDDVAESNGNYYFRWVMDVKFKKFKKGQTIRTIGVTHVRFNEEGKVVLHQDYWDSAAGLFEHIPIIGGTIRWIKGRL